MADPKFTKPDGAAMKKTLLRRLVPLADRARDLATKFGARPYRIRLVRTRWSGDYRGDGVESITSIIELLPVPRVLGLDGLTNQMMPVGTNEQGDLQVDNISGRYTEEQLSGLNDDGSPPDDTEQFWWEIEFTRDDGRPSDKRRFAMSSPPTYNPTGLEWTVALTRLQGDRDRSGDLSN